MSVNRLQVVKSVLLSALATIRAVRRRINSRMILLPRVPGIHCRGYRVLTDTHRNTPTTNQSTSSCPTVVWRTAVREPLPQFKDYPSLPDAPVNEPMQRTIVSLEEEQSRVDFKFNGTGIG